MTESVQCFIGLGSNLEQPIDQLKSALSSLQQHPAVTHLSCSSLYGSKPMGPADQPDYVNAVAQLQTALEAHALLDVLQTIEQQQGRVRHGERWGPRTLDLDLLAYGDAVIDTARLQVPHPGVAERVFVVLPWLELDPDFSIPGLAPLPELATRFAADELTRLEPAPV